MAGRVADRYGALPGFESLTQLALEIRQDQRALDVLVHGLDVNGGALKRLIVWFGERLGRLKLNGTLVRPSPLSRVIELEALVAGVIAKQRGWASLRVFAGGDELADVDLVELQLRADDQIDELQRLHCRAAEIAFGPAPGDALHEQRNGGLPRHHGHDES